MTPRELLLSFAVILGDHAHGPCFHRWIPGNRDKGIVLKPHPDVNVRIWFGSTECTEGGLADNYLDPEVIVEYGRVVAGPMRGDVELRRRSDEEIECVKAGIREHPSYIHLGKFVVQDILSKPLNRLVNILRTNYGQYWLDEFPVWDSRSYSLGAYCRNVLNLKASTDAGVTWVPFQPTESRTTIHKDVFVCQPEDFSKLLMPMDWQTINKVLETNYEPTVAGRFLAHAHELFDSDNCRHAFIEGVTALELAIGEYAHKNFRKDRPKEWTALEDNLSVKQRFVALAALSGLLSDREFAAGLKVIEVRNAIVHDGADIPQGAFVHFYDFLNAIGKILTGATFKFAFAGGNCRMPAEAWDK